jgi:hypothetical protein
VCAFLAQGLGAIRSHCQTIDEAVHLTAGYSYLTTRDFRMMPEHPPFPKLLAALAVYLRFQLPFHPDPELWNRLGEVGAFQWQLGGDFLYKSPRDADAILQMARLPNLAIGAALIGLVGWWSFRLWGTGAALLAIGLASFEPNLIAHASLVTPDISASFFILLTVYLLWEYVGSPSDRLFLGIALSLGLALASKSSSIILIIILLAAIGGHVLRGGTVPSFGQPRCGRSGTLRDRLEEAHGSACLLIALAILLVIVPIYWFQGLTTWLAGLKEQIAHQDGGHPAFFLGEYSQQGWWGYFPVAFAIKTPVGTLAVIGASLLLVRFGKPLGWNEAIFLLLPPALYFAAMTQARVNIGVRYILPVYPFLLVLASRLATMPLRPAWSLAALLTVPAGWTAISCLQTAPHQLAYFNELIGGPGQGYRYLGDSNLDWGQDLKGVKEFMDHEQVPMIYLCYSGNADPDYYGIRYQYVPPGWRVRPPPTEWLPAETTRELLAISVTNLQGIYAEDRGLFHWFEQREPTAKVGYSIHVYDLTADADAHLALGTAYWKQGFRDAAAREARKCLAIDPTHHAAARLLRLSSTPTQAVFGRTPEAE